MQVGTEVRLGNRLYRVIRGTRVQRGTWSAFFMKYDWVDVKTEAARLKVLAAFEAQRAPKEA
jgi:hypothetical protein